MRFYVQKRVGQIVLSILTLIALAAMLTCCGEETASAPPAELPEKAAAEPAADPPWCGQRMVMEDFKKKARGRDQRLAMLFTIDQQGRLVKKLYISGYLRHPSVKKPYGS